MKQVLDVPNQLTDETIIDRIKRGEKALYELIIRRYNPKLYRIGMAIVKDENEAEEVMQTVYVKAYEKLEQFNGASSFGTWLTRILINESLQSLRRSQRNSFTNISDEPEQTTRMSFIDHRTPERKVLNSELKAVLERAIMNLPKRYRLVYIMREVEKMSVNETASALQLTESNVKVILNRAKAMLREHLTRQYEETEIFDFHLSRCDRIVEAVMSRI